MRFSATRGNAVGLLEELEQEAQKRGIAGDESARRKAERESAYRVQLEPALDALHGFLTELIDKLKTLQPRTALRYQVPGYGEIVGYIEHEYRLDDNRQASSREIALDFPCAIATEECPAIDVEGVTRVRAVAGSFQRHRIGGMLAPRKDAAGDVVAATFRAKGRIPLSAHFHADAESGQLRMSFSNFDGLGTTTKSVVPAQVDEALYEQIGRFLLREPNTLLSEDLPEAYRKQLRSKIQQQEIKRRWEMRISDTREIELAELRRVHTVQGRLNGVLDGLRNAGGIGDAFGKLRALVARRR
jgi:hypothetical protein